MSTYKPTKKVLRAQISPGLMCGTLRYVVNDQLAEKPHDWYRHAILWKVSESPMLYAHQLGYCPAPTLKYVVIVFIRKVKFILEVDCRDRNISPVRGSFGSVPCRQNQHEKQINH